MKNLITLLTIVFLLNDSFAQTYSSSNGNWNAGPTWDTGVVPPDNGDTVFIEAADLVTVNVNTTYTVAMVIMVRGILKLDATLVLPSGSQIVLDGGVVTSGNNGWRLDIGASTWGGFKNNPVTTGVLTDLVLDVKSIDFSAEQTSSGEVKISWSIDATKEIKEVSLEWSVDGDQFETIETFSNEIEGEVYLNGHNNSLINYYRLQVQDENNTSYSKSEKVTSAYDELSVYPNPFQNNLVIKGISSLENIEVRIVDMLGTMVLTKSIATGVLNTSELNAGLYFVNVYQNGTLLQRQRVLKN